MRQASKLFAFVALSITASGCGELPASSMVVSQEVRPTEAGTTFDVDPWQRRAPHGAIEIAKITCYGLPVSALRSSGVSARPTGRWRSGKLFT